MSVLDKQIEDLTEQIEELKKLQIVEEWFVKHCGELHSINNFHSSYAACVVLSSINGMTDAIDNAMTFNPLPMYKIKDGNFTSFYPEDLLDADNNNERIHPVVCCVDHLHQPTIKFVINSPHGLIRVQREVMGSDIEIKYRAYGRPTKYKNVSIVNYSYWFNSFVEYAVVSEYAINQFTLYNKIEEKL